jgi:hypothetical protein
VHILIAFSRSEHETLFWNDHAKEIEDGTFQDYANPDAWEALYGTFDGDYLNEGRGDKPTKTDKARRQERRETLNDTMKELSRSSTCNGDIHVHY